jgi:phosphatidylinositol alpha-1,6-mannosyltransferase
MVKTISNTMKLLIITRNFPPLRGGMERLNWHLAVELAKRAEVRIVAPEGARELTPKGISIVETPLNPLRKFILWSFGLAIREARHFRPDTILAGSGLTAPIAWLAAKTSKARAVVYVHGLDLSIRHRIYRMLWLPFIRRMDKVIANSSATAALAERLGIPKEHIIVIPPGVDLPRSFEKSERRQIQVDFRTRYALGNGPILLSVGRLTTRKGVLEFVRDVLPRIVHQVPEVQFAIVGEAPTQSLAAAIQSPEAIKEAALLSGVSEHIHFLPWLDGEDLQAAYYAADVHIFPVRSLPNDIEGFGMVAIEAAAHDLPTVAYATGGIIDAVADGVSGRLIPPNNEAEFSDAVVNFLSQPVPVAPIQNFASKFSWDLFGEKVRAAIER